MKTKMLTLALIFLLPSILLSQTLKLEALVSDKITGFALSEVNVIIQNTSYSAITSNNGKFSFENLQPGEYNLEIIHYGYKTYHIKVNLDDKTNIGLHFFLEPYNVETGEITVTSTRYESMIKDIPMPLEVVDNHFIDRLPATTISDILSVKPGLNVIKDGVWATDISIRGLSRNNVVTLIDGNRIETANDISARLSMVDLNDIERVEVIKGGTSSLYGTGAFGGIVSIITGGQIFSTKPYFNASMFSGINFVNNGAFGNLLIKTGGKFWYAKLSGTLRNAENIKTPDGTLPNSHYRDNNISASFGLKPLLNHFFKFDYQQFNASDVGIPGGNPFFPTNAVVTYPDEKREMYSAEYKISDLFKPLKSISLKYFYQTIYRDVDNQPGQVAIAKTPSGKLKQKTFIDDIVPKANHYTNGVQLQTDWVLGKYNTLVAGIDAWQRSLSSNREKYMRIYNYDTTSGSLISQINKTLGEKPLPDADYRSIGAYSQDESRFFNEKLKFIIGLRADQVKVNNSLTLNPVYDITNGVRNNTPAGQKVIWNASESSDVSWSGNIGLLYHLLKDFDITFNSARSFRSPSIEERYQYIDLGSFLRIGNPSLSPEQGLFFDLGFRIWKQKLSFKWNIFYNSFTDLVVEQPGTWENRPAFIKTNVGKARLYGYDFDFMYNFYKSFVAYGSLSYVRGEDIGNNLDLPQMPPLNGRLGIKTQAINFLNCDFSAVLFNNQDKVAPGEIPTPGYSIFDFYISTFEINIMALKMQVFGGVENIFDKSYRNHLSTNRGLLTAEPGRNFYFKLKLNL